MRFHKVLILLVALMLLTIFVTSCGELAEEMDPEGPATNDLDANNLDTGNLDVGEPDAGEANNSLLQGDN